MKELETKYVFIDTSIFIGNNFFYSKKIRQLEKLAFNDEIIILTTKIIEQEILGQLEKALSNAKRGIREIKQLLNKDCRILRNIDEFSTFFNIPELSEANLKSLKDKYELFKTSNSVKFIDYTNTDIKEIFNDYFNGKPPFKDGKKKSEFPDAFNYAALKNWCLINSQKVYLLTNDKDFNDCVNNSIIVKSMDEYLELVNREFELNKITVESKIDYVSEQIINQINEYTSVPLKLGRY